jgi:hypothetical protein
MNSEKAIALIINEFKRATSMYGAFNSAHEGYAALLEEVDELWDEVKKNPKKRDYEAMKKEAVQVGAMAFRFLVDVIEEVPTTSGKPDNSGEAKPCKE